MEKKRSFGVWLVTGIMHLVGSLPLGFHRASARFVAWLLKDVFRYRTDVVMVNLARSFPEKSYEELKDIRNRFYGHLARVFTEMFWIGACRGEKGRRRLHKSHIVEMTNPEELNRLYKLAPQLMILQAHTGNWELTAGFSEYSYTAPLELDPKAFAVAYTALHSPFWDAVMLDNRLGPVIDWELDALVESHRVLRFAVARRHQKFCFVFDTDQYPYIANGSNLTVEFLHQPTHTMTGGAALACRMNMAVVYLSYRCREDGGYTMTFIPVTENAGEMTPEQIMRTYYKLLEEDLRVQPWNYLWTHKRWKQL